MPPPVSVIVRAKDEARTIERALASVREQTVPAELIVIDSGSRDGTVQIARRWCDRLIEIAPEDFSYGYALNVAAAEASADVHAALSAHCRLPRPDWIARSLALYDRRDVAATNGALVWPDGSPAPPGAVRYQRVEDVATDPHWGFSNHGSTWRAAAWREHPFDEELVAAEDKEWALRVLRAGWTIAFARELWVDMSHAWRTGPAQIFRRQRKEYRELGRFAPVGAPTLRELGSDWWHDIPRDRHSALAHRFLNWRRLTELAGKYVGRWEAARLTGGDAERPRLRPRDAGRRR